MSIYNEVVSTQQTPSGAESPYLERPKISVPRKLLCLPNRVPLRTFWLSNRAFILLKELCPLLLQKLLLLLLMLKRGTMIFMANGLFPHQRYVLSLGLAVVPVIKVAVISQCHSHSLYLFSVSYVLGTRDFHFYNVTATWT